MIKWSNNNLRPINLQLLST